MATNGIQNKKTVSAVTFLDKRDIFPSIADIKNEADFIDIMALAGRAEKVEATQWDYHTFVNDDLSQQLTAGTVTNNATTAVTIQVTPIGAVRVNDLLTCTDGKQGVVYSVTRGGSYDTIVLKGDVALSVTAADKLPIGSRAEYEGSSAPENLKYVPTKYYNKIQIFRETDQITDVELQNEITVNVNGQPYIVDYNGIMKVLSLKAKVNYQMIAGQMSSDSFSDASPVIADANSYTAQRTRGLYDYIATYGVNDTVTSVGTLAWADLTDLVSQLVANRAPNNYLMLHNTAVGMVYDAFLKGLNSSGVYSGKLTLDGKELNLETEKFSLGGINFQKMRLPILDNDKLFNFSGNVFRKNAYFIPADKIKTVGGAPVGRLRIRYKKQTSAGNMGSEMIRETVTGMFSELGNNSSANRTKEWYTAQGLEALGVQHFAKQIVIS